MNASQFLDALAPDPRHCPVTWGRSTLTVTGPSGARFVVVNVSRDLLNYFVLNQDGEMGFAGAVSLRLIDARHAQRLASQASDFLHA